LSDLYPSTCLACVVDEAVNRLHRTPFAKDGLIACRAPESELWVTAPEYENSFF